MARSEILDNPLSAHSCALKAPVRHKLDHIALQTGAVLSVVNPELASPAGGDLGAGPSTVGGVSGASGDAGAIGAPILPGSSSQAAKGAFGLETERVCEILVEGPLGAIERAKVQLLVMLDELVRPPPPPHPSPPLLPRRAELTDLHLL